MKLVKQFIFYIILLLHSFLVKIFNCNYCSVETCRRCCQVLPSGCVNMHTFNLRRRYSSYLSFCADCECGDPITGCGWAVEYAGRVECSSCDYIKSLINVQMVSYIYIYTLYYSLEELCRLWLYSCEQ